jgi:hypothetical protein
MKKTIKTSGAKPSAKNAISTASSGANIKRTTVKAGGKPSASTSPTMTSTNKR